MNTNAFKFYRWTHHRWKWRFYFVQKDGQTYALAGRRSAYGRDSVKVLPTTRIWSKNSATTLEVTATQDQFGWGTITEVQRDLGVFTDFTW